MIKVRYNKRRMQINIVCLLSLITLMACNGGTSANSSNSPIITTMTISNMPESVRVCYESALSFSSDVVAINNNGVMTGMIKSQTGSGCIQQDYLFGNNGSQLEIIPLYNFSNTNLTATGARNSGISTNLITIGITFASDGSPSPFEFATYNNYLTPKLIENTNYLIGVSENGTFAAGFDLGGNPTLFNTALGLAYNLTYNNLPLSGASGLYAVSNSGIAGGMLGDISGNTSGILCFAENKACSYVVGGPSGGFSANIRSVSSNSRWIYGFAYFDNYTQLFSVNLETFAVTPLYNDLIIRNLVVSDTGDIVVRDNDSKSYLLVPLNITASENSLYSMSDLAAQLNLPSNLDLTNAYISPNGKYLAFDVSDFGTDDLFGLRIYFPDGIANYVQNNLTPVSLNNSRSSFWFKGQNVITESKTISL